MNIFLPLVLLLMLSGKTFGQDRDQTLPEDYAESVMIDLLSEDGLLDVSLRLARFPGERKAHLWFHTANADGAWSVVDEGLSTSSSAATDTPARFVGSSTQAHLEFVSTPGEGGFSGKVTGTFMTQATRHPDTAGGNVPVQVDLVFVSDVLQPPSATGRLELAGRVHGTLGVAGQTWTLNELGKWHEQIGPRASFAPAFTYLNVLNEETSLLAIGFADRVVGTALIDGQRSAVSQFQIEPQGQTDRSFQITLADGRHIQGVARVVQRWSVPIEGVRRPGASVLVDSNVGSLRGSLNDWQPAEVSAK